MKNMQNFAAQHLTKKQMNQVTGGGSYTCTVVSDGRTFSVNVQNIHIGGAYVNAAVLVSEHTGAHAVVQGCR